jgi:hypothetical protein
MVSDGVGGYHGRAELGLLRRRDQGDVSACTVRSVVSKAWGWGGGEVASGLCSPMVHVPFGGSTEGARQSLCLARYQGGSSRVTMLLVAERIVCAVVAAPTATPGSVRIDRRCPAPPVDYRAG